MRRHVCLHNFVSIFYQDPQYLFAVTTKVLLGISLYTVLRPSGLGYGRLVGAVSGTVKLTVAANGTTNRTIDGTIDGTTG